MDINRERKRNCKRRGGIVLRLIVGDKFSTNGYDYIVFDKWSNNELIIFNLTTGKFKRTQQDKLIKLFDDNKIKFKLSDELNQKIYNDTTT